MMKKLNSFIFVIVLISLASCGGGGGADNAASSVTKTSVPAGISQAEELQKQYRKKAKELIDIQEYYELLYEMMTPERRLINAKRFQAGQKQLNSLQQQIDALKSAEDISFLSLEEIQHKYRLRLDDILIVDNQSGLIETHSRLINLSPESLKEIEDKKIQKVDFQSLTAGQELKVYETSAFIYIKKI